MAEYIYFPVSGIQRPDGTWLDGSEVADELNRLAAENTALRELVEWSERFANRMASIETYSKGRQRGICGYCYCKPCHSECPVPEAKRIVKACRTALKEPANG